LGLPVGEGDRVADGLGCGLDISSTISTGRVHARAEAINTRVESIKTV
jgi:hypothetical protein